MTKTQIVHTTKPAAPKIVAPAMPEKHQYSDEQKHALKQQIKHLLKEQDASLVAHYYTDADLQELARNRFRDRLRKGRKAPKSGEQRFSDSQASSSILLCMVRRFQDAL